MRVPETQKADHTDAGLSMVEIVLSMFLLGLLSMGLLPLMFGVIEHSVQNREYLEATQFAKRKVTEIQAMAPSAPGTPTSCSAVRQQLLVQGGLDPETNMFFRYHVPPCPGTYPTTLNVTISVNDAEALREIASLSTLVRVGAA